MTIQHVGQDFTTQVKLNLLPGIKELPRGVFRTDIQYVTETAGTVTMHHMSQNMMGNKSHDFDIIVGRDVKYLDVHIYCHNSFPSNPLISYRYHLRVDQLLMLNMAVKLLKL